MRLTTAGITRSGNLEPDNLYTHPLHKIPVRVDSDIRRAVIENPHLKPSDLSVGMLQNTADATSKLIFVNYTDSLTPVS